MRNAIFCLFSFSVLISCRSDVKKSTAWWVYANPGRTVLYWIDPLAADTAKVPVPKGVHHIIAGEWAYFAEGGLHEQNSGRIRRVNQQREEELLDFMAPGPGAQTQEWDVSQDGKKIAWKRFIPKGASNFAGTYELYVANLADRVPRLVWSAAYTGLAPQLLGFSPDGADIFVHENNWDYGPAGGLFKVNVQDKTITVFFRDRAHFPSVAFDQQGSKLAVFPGERTDKLIMIDLETNQLMDVPEVSFAFDRSILMSYGEGAMEERIDVEQAWFLPAGTRLLCELDTDEGHPYGLYLLDVQSGKSRKLLGLYTENVHARVACFENGGGPALITFWNDEGYEIPGTFRLSPDGAVSTFSGLDRVSGLTLIGVSKS
ncbi:MAG: hypothetical protein KDD10_11825 [Phaeodactylibacter sp.]|nr:hypothetical protein [Phaeodactylibacter sp.]MCB9293961.1 hypothetical protein [Lewinellaceae bacterium]